MSYNGGGYDLTEANQMSIVQTYLVNYNMMI